MLKKLFSNGAKDLLDSVGGVLTKVVTNDKERLEATNEIKQVVLERLARMAELQSEVIKTEMTGNWLQRSWRPIVMLTFTLVVVYSKFIAPLFGMPTVVLESDFWDLMQLGLGGYVVGRSIEKVTGKITDNVDLTFLKKKNRKSN